MPLPIRRQRPALLVLIALLAGCGSDAPPHAPGGSWTPPAIASDGHPDTWPTAGWQAATPESQGFPAGAFDTLAADAAATLPYYTSLLVIRNGWLLHESYHDTPSDSGNGVAKKHHVWSVTKSVTSMTLGRAMTLGDLAPADLDRTVADVMPAAVVSTLAPGDGRRDITLRHALQMRSGLAWNEPAWLLNTSVLKDPLFRAYLGMEPACPADALVLLCTILQQPLAYTPGTVWNYNTYDTYLASSFFTALSGQSLNQYAASHLFAEVGAEYFGVGDWANVPDPITFGGGLLYIASRDLARLGLVMLYDGQWNGSPLLSPDWVTLSTTGQGTGQVARFDAGGNPRPLEAGDVPVDIPYAMQWWRVTGPGLGGTPSLSARGLGGQMMHLFKDKELLIIITCDDVDLSGREDAINAFLKTRILDKLGA